jgi:hypothetical protein
MKKMILLLSFLIFACGTIPTDPSPAWSLNNRYSVEMQNDCNTVNHSVGLSGCAFTDAQLGGNIILPVLWGGRISGVSYNCKNVAFSANNTDDNVLQIADLYTAANKQSCSFQFTRTVTEKQFTADNTMIGRFFIKIIPANAYYSKLKFSIGNDNFTGVGWYQKKTDVVGFSANSPTLTFNPTGNSGKLIIACGANIISQTTYTSKPFNVTLDTNESCDLEISAINADSPKIDLGTFIQEVNLKTIDITPPSVSIKSKKITFTFNDKDLSGKKPVVYLVKVDGVTCVKKNACTVAHTKDTYVVKGWTLGLRQFFGKYRVSTSKFEVIQ